jgi:hypothetical protein
MAWTQSYHTGKDFNPSNLVTSVRDFKVIFQLSFKERSKIMRFWLKILFLSSTIGFKELLSFLKGDPYSGKFRTKVLKSSNTRRTYSSTGSSSAERPP